MSMRLVLELILAASDLSALPVAPVMPRIEVLPAESMPCTCQAHYEADVVRLRDDVDPDTLFGRSVIVHEITHHLQAHADGRPRDERDRFRREVQAVATQNAYLKAHGSATRAAYTHRTDD